MKNAVLHKEIDQIHHVLRNPKPHVPVVNIDSTSLFHFIRDEFSRSLPAADQVLFPGLFERYENVLTNVRAGNLEQAKFWIDCIDQNPADLPVPVMIGLESLYFSVRAYFYYASGDYHVALQKLRTAIGLANCLANENMPVMIACCYEQSLNCCRVYYACGEGELVCKEGGKLLLYISAGHSFPNFSLTDTSHFRKEFPEMQERIVQYATNVIFSKIECLCMIKPGLTKLYFKHLLSPFCEYSGADRQSLSGYRESMITLMAFYLDEYENYIAALFGLLPLLSGLPVNIQKQLLLNLIELGNRVNYPDQEGLVSTVLHFSTVNFGNELIEVAQGKPRLLKTGR